MRTSDGIGGAPGLVIGRPGGKTLPVEVHHGPKVVLRIISGWCKSCGICADVCAKKCLKVTGTSKVSVVQLESCNRCRLCEFLCPDFAISAAEPTQSAAAQDKRH